MSKRPDWAPRTQLICIRCGARFDEWWCDFCEVDKPPNTTRPIIDAECESCHDLRLHPLPDDTKHEREFLMTAAKHRTPRLRMKLTVLQGYNTDWLEV
jgi:hypothetical protein